MRPLEIALKSGLENCARCGCTHEEPLDWKRFDRPPDNYQFWATCPTTGDPILLFAEELEEDQS